MTEETVRQLVEEVSRLRAELGQTQSQMQVLAGENVSLKSGIVDQIPSLISEMKSASSKGSGSEPLIDIKGIGKPSSFDNTEAKFLGWTRKVENFFVGIFGESLRDVLTYSVESEEPLVHAEIQEAYPDVADIALKSNKIFTALVGLTEDESNDIVVGAGPGCGLEAWRKLHRRWDPSVGSRKRSLLEAILRPGRCKMTELQGSFEKWLQQVSRYERRKDSKGQRTTIG